MIILLTNPFSRKTEDAYNFLKNEFTVKILCLDSESKFVKAIYRKQDIIYYNDLFEASLKKPSEQPVCILPMEEEWIEILHTQEEIFKANNISYLIPRADIFKIFKSKELTQKWAKENGIETPETYTQGEFLENIDVIFKPKEGSGSKGIYRHLNFTGRINIPANYIAQKLVKNGEKVEGVFALAKEGKVINIFSHERIKTWPKKGGVTVYSKSHLNIRLIEKTKKIIHNSYYSGMIMAEFLYDKKTDEYVLIEINPRPWGSLLLSEFSGIPLLNNYILLCNNQNLKSASFQPKYIRWLIPYGFIHFFFTFDLRLIYDLLFERKNVFFINISNSNVFRAVKFSLLSKWVKDKL